MALNILPIFGRDKEKDAVKWFLRHAEIIEGMSKPLQEILDAAFKKKDFKLVEEKAKEINNLEKEADKARRTTAALLYEGAFLPIMRSRLYGLSGRIDDVADSIKNVSNMLHYLKGKKVNPGTVSILVKLGDNAVKVASLLLPTLQALFDNTQDFTNLVAKIKNLEEQSDIYQREMFDRILFDKSMNPVTVQIISWIGHSLSEVCDNAKHVSDTMTLLKIMKVA